MSNSILTTTTKNTTPHTKLNDEQLNPHNNNKNTTPHTKLNDKQLNPHNNNKKHNTTHKVKRWATQSSQQQQKTPHHTQS